MRIAIRGFGEAEVPTTSLNQASDEGEDPQTDHKEA